MSTQTAPTDVAHAFFGAMNSWDFDELERIFARDIVFEMPYSPRRSQKRIEGSDAVMEFIRLVQRFFDEPRLHDIRLDSLASDPGELVAEFRSDANLVNGANYANNYIARFTIRDGQIARYVEFYDPQVLLDAEAGKS